MCLPLLGLRLQGEPPCATPASSRGRGNGQEEEEDRRPVAESSSPGASPRTGRERHAWTLKVGTGSGGLPLRCLDLRSPSPAGVWCTQDGLDNRGAGCVPKPDTHIAWQPVSRLCVDRTPTRPDELLTGTD